jgi:hypothetical protein
MVKITQINGKPSNYLQKNFLLTSLDDLSKLPRVGIRGNVKDEDDSSTDEECAYGSTAQVVVNGVLKHYILTPDNKWVEYTEGSVNSGGGGSDPSDPGSGFIEL